MKLTAAIGYDESQRSGLAALYRSEAEKARTLAYLLTGDREWAEDLVQDAFVRLIGRFVHIRKPDSFHIYLRRTIINLHFSRLRRLRVEREWIGRQSAVRGSPREDDQVEQREQLLAALNVLPKRQRVAVILRYCLDYSEAEVATAMGCSLGAGRSLISRGIRTLRTNWGSDERG
jgi:RNA polymerase sigma-70 factor (sigma-E family)